MLAMAAHMSVPFAKASPLIVLQGESIWEEETSPIIWCSCYKGRATHSAPLLSIRSSATSKKSTAMWRVTTRSSIMSLVGCPSTSSPRTRAWAWEHPRGSWTVLPGLVSTWGRRPVRMTTSCRMEPGFSCSRTISLRRLRLCLDHR